MPVDIPAIADIALIFLIGFSGILNEEENVNKYENDIGKPTAKKSPGLVGNSKATDIPSMHAFSRALNTLHSLLVWLS